MAEEEERIWEDGYRAAMRRIMGETIKVLGNDPVANAEQWRLERADAITALRDGCRTWGDNEWEPTLHLSDIIDKHLLRHLS